MQRGEAAENVAQVSNLLSGLPRQGSGNAQAAGTEARLRIGNPRYSVDLHWRLSPEQCNEKIHPAAA